MNVFVFFQPVRAQKEFNQLGEFTCKWWTQSCPDGYSREICVRDGTGNTCTCGDVTRAC